MTKKAFSFLVVAVLAAMASGCAEEREPIDRVQPYALPKAFFVGEDLEDPADNPEFYSQGTLIDVGYGAAQDGLFTSTYAQPLSRVRFEITEDLLIARLAYERVDDSDGKGAGKAVLDGIIVAAYPIQSHFDIVYAYNPTTGEKLNVLEENTTDRPWNEREYIRVDFSRNLSTDNYDFDTLSLLGVFGGIEYEPLAYYVDDPGTEDAPQFDIEGGYFDITNKAFAKPGVVDLSALGWGIDAFPSCFLDYDFFSGSAPYGMCAPVELTIRQSFRRVEDVDYEPIHWDGYRFQAHGGFTVDRYGYARNYGMSDEQWHRFLTRYQIWQRAHYYEDPEGMVGAIECFTPETTKFGADPHRDDDLNGTEDECELAGAGSRCDEFTQKCTLPYRERETAVIPWYYTQGSNPEYFEGTELATHEWDVALRSAVVTARYVECIRTGGEACEAEYPVVHGQQDDNEDAIALALEVDDCRAGKAYADLGKDEAKCVALADSIGAERGYSAGAIALARMPEMVVLCHSPVEAGDHAACGSRRLPAGTTALQCAQAREEGDDETLAVCAQALSVRRGDLRYHQVNVISEPQTPSPWGIYTDAEDPLTGQKVSASINVWSHITDLWSQQVVDQARYIKGELATEDVTEGTWVHKWAQAAESASSAGSLPMMSREEMQRRLAEFSAEEAGEMAAAPEAFAAAHPEVMEATRQLKEEMKGVKAALGAASVSAPVYAARRAAAMGSQTEAELMTAMVQQQMGVEGLAMSESVLDVASPLRGGNPSLQRDLFHMKENALAERGACMLHMAEAPLGIAPLADVLEQKFGTFNPADPQDMQQQRAEKMRKYVAQRAHYSVIAHEMGHSVGLRHNFVSSSDAWNFRPQYWQLRTEDGKVTDECTDLVQDGSKCVGPRYFDPMTPNEEANLEWMFMHSSIMEYAGETTQDFLGLGAWDFATARMFYGDAVAVYQDPSYVIGTDRAATAVAKLDNFGGILGIQHDFKGDPLHYSQLQKEFDLIQQCVEVDPVKFKSGRFNQKKDGAWHPVLDGLLVRVGGKYTRCRQQPVDYVDWDDLRAPSDEEYSGYSRADRAVDDQGRVRFPYGFATDRWADLGNLSVYRHDNGADPYEIFNFLITQQEVGHIFDNYRRGRQTFSVRAAAARTLTRFNEKLRDGAKGMGLLKNYYRDFAVAMGYNFDQLWPSVAPLFFRENMLASGLVFDHFTRIASRPEAGPHYKDSKGGSPVLRSEVDAQGQLGDTVLYVPNGATGVYRNVSWGGRPVENKLAGDQGEYSSEITVNAGSYYDKMWASMLFTESVDNFISDSRQDFVDARYRAVSLADLFPDGYRRFLANALTGDDFIKGVRVAAHTNEKPVLDDEGYPAQGFGWTTWWGTTPQACFAGEGSTICSSYGTGSGPFEPYLPAKVNVIDPQIGWEQQKFFIAWTMLYLPENQQQKWIDMLRMWELGEDADPGFENRIEFHYPAGKVYVAKTYGRETLFGKTVEKGVAARVLEYANTLLSQGYDCDDGPDLNGDGKPDWFLPKFNEKTGEPLVKFDKTVSGIQEGYVYPNGVDGCNAKDNSGCTCTANRACMELEKYVEVPFFMRQTMTAYQLPQPAVKGLYD